MAEVRMRGSRTSMMTKGKVGFISVIKTVPLIFAHKTWSTSRGVMARKPMPVARIMAAARNSPRSIRISGGFDDICSQLKIIN
jgi:hypothetical protein